MVRCPSCGEENPPRFRFCGNCGAALPASSAAPREVRKTVTVVFCDLAGSTGLGERLDPEALRQVMGRYYERMRTVLEHHGGSVEKFIGDAVMAVFGVPVVHEDDALRAVLAALQMRDAVSSLNEELAARWGVTIVTRTGVNTGDVVTGQGAETLATGDAVNVAARLEQAAQPGEILIGDVTHRLVRARVRVEDVEALDLRGKSSPVRAWRLLGEADADAARTRTLEAPMIGRDREITRLAQAWSDAVGDRHCELFTVLGAAGVGKSRLVREFLATVPADATVLRGRCLPYGDGITYWPFSEALRDHAGIADSDDAETALARLRALLAGHPDEERLFGAIADAVGLRSGGTGTDEIAWAARRTLEWLAHERPVVVVFDDIHWAEPAFFDLIEHVADWSRDHAILLLCMARPELLETRPGWGGGKLHASTVLLEPLGANATTELVDRLVGGIGLDEGVRARIVEAAEGNPLFIEEMIGMLVDDELLRREDGRWVVRGDLTQVQVPPSVRALLAARLDRLAPGERAVAERGSVVGRIFERRAVTALAPEPLREMVAVHLLSLVRKELVRPDETAGAGDETYRFRHLLIRDAAYESLPKQERAELHERFARWLEAAVSERLAEYAEVVAYHLEQAHRYRLEIGPDDEASARLAQDTGERLLAVADRAYTRGDVSAEARLLRRALAVLPRDHPRRALSTVRLGAALTAAGSLDEALHAFDEAAAIAAQRDDRALAAWVTISRVPAMAMSTSGWTGQGAVAEAEEALATLEAAGDARGVADALFVLFELRLHLGEIDQMLPLARRAIEAARTVGDPRLTVRAHGSLVSAAMWGATPADEALEMAHEFLRQAQDVGGRFGEALARSLVARLEALRGEVDEARRQLGEARRILEELGALTTLYGSSHWAFWIEMFAGTPERAEAALREADAGFARIGERSYRSTTVAELAHALVAAGRPEEADAFADLGLELASADDMATLIAATLARARALAHRGRHEEARVAADAAMRFSRRSSVVIDRARTLDGLAEIAELAGDVALARERLTEAIAVLDAKRARPWADRLRHRLDQLPGG